MGGVFRVRVSLRLAGEWMSSANQPNSHLLVLIAANRSRQFSVEPSRFELALRPRVESRDLAGELPEGDKVNRESVYKLEFRLLCREKSQSERRLAAKKLLSSDQSRGDAKSVSQPAKPTMADATDLLGLQVSSW